MLKIANMSVAYGKHLALDDVSLEVGKGELVVILGANGAGKSSLLRAIAGISEGRVDGRVTFRGDDMAGLAPDAIVARGIALVPEGRAIFGDLSVAENLRLGAYTDHARRDMERNLALVHELFPRLRERARQAARTMSGGEQQMVAIGRALMSAPSILMLDEPSLGLSPLLSKELFQVLVRIRDAGLGVLMVEQNARLSLAVADRGYLIEVGRLVGHDTAQNLARDAAVQAAYLGAAAGSRAAKGSVAAKDTPPKGGAAPAAGMTAPLAPSSPQVRRAAPVMPIKADDFAGLVAKAAIKAKERPQSAPMIPAPKPSSSPPPLSSPPPPAKPPVAKSAAATVPSPVSANGGDRIAAMLRDMEQAAANARLVAEPGAGGNGAAPNGHGNRNAGGHDSVDDMAAAEPLPEIKIYGRKEVQIFRRDGEGRLTPAD